MMSFVTCATPPSVSFFILVREMIEKSQQNIKGGFLIEKLFYKIYTIKIAMKGASEES